MPLFEFVCEKCNEKFEVLVFDKENAQCPKCKSAKVAKQFSSFTTASSLSNCASANSCQRALKHKHKCSGGCCYH
jgi:putative FmdB family regulatory protein